MMFKLEIFNEHLCYNDNDTQTYLHVSSYDYKLIMIPKYEIRFHLYFCTCLLLTHMQILRIIRRLENIIKHIVHRSQHGVRLLSISIIKYAHIDNEKITVMKLEHLISKAFGSRNNCCYLLLLTCMLILNISFL